MIIQNFYISPMIVVYMGIKEGDGSVSTYAATGGDVGLVFILV